MPITDEQICQEAFVRSITEKTAIFMSCPVYRLTSGDLVTLVRRCIELDRSPPTTANTDEGKQ